MDELARLRRFQPEATDSAAAYARAREALGEAIGGKRRNSRRTIAALVAVLAATALPPAAYAVYETVIVGAPAPAGVKVSEGLLQRIKGELIPTGGHPNPG